MLQDVVYCRLLYFDKIHIYIYGKNPVQSKYQNLLEAGYHIIEASNDKILPVSRERAVLTDENQKLVIFDDFVCEKKKHSLIIS